MGSPLRPIAVSFLAILFLLVPSGCRQDRSEPALVAHRLTARLGPAQVARTIERLGAAVLASDLPGWPDLETRAECGNDSAVLRWFLDRGVSEDWVGYAFREGVLATARGEAVDWEARAAEAAARGSWLRVRLPVLPGLALRWWLDDAMEFGLQIDARGEILYKQAPVPLAELIGFLLPKADPRRDERDPRRRSEVWMRLLCDRDLPFGGFRPLLTAFRDPRIGLWKVEITYYPSRTHDLASLPVFLVPHTEGAPVLHLTASPAPPPAPGALVPPEEADREVVPLLAVDDDVPMQRVAEALAGCLRSGSVSVDLRCSSEVNPVPPVK